MLVLGWLFFAVHEVLVQQRPPGALQMLAVAANGVLQMPSPNASGSECLRLGASGWLRVLVGEWLWRMSSPNASGGECLRLYAGGWLRSAGGRMVAANVFSECRWRRMPSARRKWVAAKYWLENDCRKCLRRMPVAAKACG